MAVALQQGVINCEGTETFAKEPKLAKLLRELKPTLVPYNKKSPLVFVACVLWQIRSVLDAFLWDKL